MKRMNYYFDEEIMSKLQAISKDTGMSMSALMRQAVIQFLEQPKLKVEKGYIMLYSSPAPTAEKVG